MLRTLCLPRNQANILVMTLGFFLLFTAFNTTQVPVVLCPHTASPPLYVPVLRCQAPTRRSRRKFFSRIVRHPLPPQQTVTIWNSCAGTPCSVSRPSWRPPASASLASNVRSGIFVQYIIVTVFRLPLLRRFWLCHVRPSSRLFYRCHGLNSSNRRYIASLIYIIPLLVLLCSCFIGVGAAILWTAQAQCVL